MNKRDVYFYSQNCQFCKNLDGLLGSMPIKFVKICVEKYPRNNLPKFLDVVPTLVLRDGNIIKGKNAIEWAKMFSGGNSQQQSNQQQQNQQQKQQQNQQPNNEDIKPIHSGEMFGFSDSFSYLGGDNTNENSNSKVIDHSFSFLNGNDNSNLNDFNSQNTRNNSSNDLDRAYEDMMEQRRKDVNI
tara:strand:+ start:21 stop:575 length:555 start_codon:yes stop_codon:yes gene_type:complete